MAEPALRKGHVLAFCGSSWRPARPRRLVEAAVQNLRAAHGVDADLFDLVDAGPGIAAFRREEMDRPARALLERIESASALIIGCPVFQGGYPGLFKHVFDQIPEGALRDVPVLLTACGGGLRHALIVEHHLRPLFGYFEAMTVPTAVYACATELEGKTLAPSLEQRLDVAVAQFAALLRERRSAA
ncbi:NAD(P)H-dependent oxidoreductase [Rhodobacteraceae bacterium F11138]|nr:NAD(P)H-dependent oxidoreductase [Rhodobacteraceae bacterium F11138]